ncbi:hypothetical protein [Aeromonas salmonicida]|uniref:hypothetical protein n=1 Tax=Aeromonas salmonicida TaxID=645 RepID=UPI00366B2CE3
MALAIASILWLAAMQLHEPSDTGLVNSVSLPPGGQWRLSFEQGRRLESASHPELYQILLAWFQREILGLLFFLPLIYLRQLSGYFGYLHKRLLICHHLQFRFCHGHSRPACC